MLNNDPNQYSDAARKARRDEQRRKGASDANYGFPSNSANPDYMDGYNANSGPHFPKSTTSSSSGSSSSWSGSYSPTSSSIWRIGCLFVLIILALIFIGFLAKLSRPTPSSPINQPSNPPSAIRNTATTSKLRQGPGEDYAVVQTLSQNQPVELIDSNPTGNSIKWAHVRLIPQEGWVNSKYLEATTGNVNQPLKKVIDKDLNLRKDAGVDKEIIITLPMGATVELLGGTQEIDGSSWVMVRQVASEGWVSAALLKP